MALKVTRRERSPVALRERSLANVPSLVDLLERSLTNVYPLVLLERYLVNVPLQKFPHKCSLVNVLFANIPSRTFSLLWRNFAQPYSSAFGMNKDTQRDKAQQTTDWHHHTVAKDT